jgi:hypothetical protein
VTAQRHRELGARFERGRFGQLVPALFGAPLVQVAAPAKPPQRPLPHPLRRLLDVLLRRRRYLVHRDAIAATRHHPVHDQQVEVDVEVEALPEGAGVKTRASRRRS